MPASLGLHGFRSEVRAYIGSSIRAERSTELSPHLLDARYRPEGRCIVEEHPSTVLRVSSPLLLL